MNIFRNTVLFIFTLFVAVSAGSVSLSKDLTAITVGPESVSLNELLIRKGRGAVPPSDSKALDSLIERMVIYKLKLVAAKEAGLDTTAAFRDDLHRFGREEAMPYLRDRHVEDSLVEVAYRHLLEILDIDQIYIPLPENPSEVKLAARRAEALRDSIRDSVRFGQSIELTGGQWPYFFEDLAYNTPVGELSPVKKSDYGFHILRVRERRKNPGSVKTRHLLKRTDGLTEEEAETKKHDIDSLYALLAAGADFTTLADANTEDPSGKGSGGELPWFGPGQMVSEFEKAAFALSPGEISRPVKTPFGWHIILCEDVRPVPPIDSIRPQIEKAIRSDERHSLALSRTVDRWKALNPDKKELNLLSAIEEIILELPEKNSDYRQKVEDYRDGVLVYEISDREIWSRAATDSAGLEDCFRRNRQDFRWEKPHFKGYVVCADNDSIADSASDWLKELLNMTAVVKPTEVRKRFGREVKIDRIIAGQGDNPIVDFLCFDGPRPENDQWKAYRAVGGRVIDAPECAADTKGAVVGRYQQELEQKWVKKLRKKHKVSINRKAIRKAFGF